MTTTDGASMAQASSALPPIAAKIVRKIKSGQSVPMKDLLADMSLCSQLEAFPAAQHSFTGLPKPRLSEIQSPLTWVSSFLAYVAVLTPDPRTRGLLTYVRLVVREAQRHSGPGWVAYDKIFQQHAALDPSVKWNELNRSLHASTILTYWSGPVGSVTSLIIPLSSALCCPSSHLRLEIHSPPATHKPWAICSFQADC